MSSGILSLTREQLVETLWQVYDLYRSALLNKLYYAERLAQTRKDNKLLEIIVAIGTSTTSIGGWAVWRTHTGQYAWAIFAGIAALISVVKPFIALPAEIERYTKLYIGHTDLYYDLQSLVNEVSRRNIFTDEMSKTLHMATERYKNLATSDDPRPNEKLRCKFALEVRKQIPTKSLWRPS